MKNDQVKVAMGSTDSQNPSALSGERFFNKEKSDMPHPREMMDSSL